MADIRESDRGYHTRVFSITSKTIGTKQICIGQKYVEKGHDRYNVYPVVNGAVGGTIGYYQVDQDTPVKDSQGVDFDVARFGEPIWTDIGKSKQMEKEKVTEKKETAKDAEIAAEAEEYAEAEEDAVEAVEAEEDIENADPDPNANFKNIKTLSTTVGNCFYETVTCALSEPPDYKTSEEKVAALRKQLGEYITSADRLPDLIARYNNYVPGLMKDDWLYGKYYRYRDEEGWDREDIEKEMENEREKEEIDEKRLNMEDFEGYEPYDEVPDYLDELFQTEFKDYFQEKKNLKDDEIKAIFLEQINTPGIYANEFIITNYQEMTNTKMLFVKHENLNYDRGRVGVQDFEFAKFTTYQEKTLDENTKFIISDYEDMGHFSLLVQIDPPLGVFQQDTLPVEVQQLLAQIEEKKELEKIKAKTPLKPAKKRTLKKKTGGDRTTRRK